MEEGKVENSDEDGDEHGDAHAQLVAHNSLIISKSQKLDLPLRILTEFTTKLYPLRNILCIQEDVDGAIARATSPKMFESPVEQQAITKNLDEDFVSAFAPCNMQCLALVCHEEMKATMKDFVIANKNILKKFRLTGTNSTMTMLREVFADDQPAVVYGPSCSFGPIGGNAELIALMCAGFLGGMIVFQDPMSAHPHHDDIACLVRQGLVHNTMMANNPTSAIMMMQVFRMALKGQGMPEFMPSFFFTLQSPAVTAYKEAQKRRRVQL